MIYKLRRNTHGQARGCINGKIKMTKKLTTKNKYWRYTLWHKKDMRKLTDRIKRYREHPDPNSLPVCIKDKDFVALLFTNPDLFFAELDFKHTAQYYRRYVRRGEK